ncbi:hypothetical protein [Bathymodiolus platifrons methanotrophic gill symbiont]|uniref:hypothetical protein n=1 Tax=Bathymodiolus platifrons methanotrophic gill symbiont TaxID=113268 RepID=UPI001FCDAD53|nr:hypothetical protein [Bathymodiolus platifrons methanotrophic gill symbiont]
MAINDENIHDKDKKALKHFLKGKEIWNEYVKSHSEKVDFYAVNFSNLKDMKKHALNMRSLILGMPAKELLGYIYTRMLKDSDDDLVGNIQFLLEYVHATLASAEEPAEVIFDEAKVQELLKLSRELKEKALLFSIESSLDTENRHFKDNTADIEFYLKSKWVSIRGNRYQALEGEFYSYVLAPHNDALEDAYGVGATKISEGFQDIASAFRMGITNAQEILKKQYKDYLNFATEQHGKPQQDIKEMYEQINSDKRKAKNLALDDLLEGGIGNVSRHTKLPSCLLEDLAYQRGEETDFFTEDNFAGTPYATLPVRKKPLIKLGLEYYAIDPCFIRDAGYRALIFKLLERKPKYKETFKENQKIMSEEAFPDILRDQFPRAKVYKEVYYKEPDTRQWVENDTVVIVDDVLYLIEAKAGAQATIDSPALNFERHSQSVNDLIIKAYKQCERFFKYLDSDDEVCLYNLDNGKHEEIARVRLSDYRMIVPIGLTVESFAPLSSFYKFKKILGKHAFISISIDDLFVLKRILPTPGIFSHYIEFRQSMAGISNTYLYDEFAHLGTYITYNRYDQKIKEGKHDWMIMTDMSDLIDKFFESESWETDPVPIQEFPDEVFKLLKALDTTQSPGWLLAESLIRDYGEQQRKELANCLSTIRKTTMKNPSGYFVYAYGDKLLFVWMQKSHHDIEWKNVKDKGSSVALCDNNRLNMIGILIEVATDGIYDNAQYFKVNVPSVQTKENEHIFDDAKLMNSRKNRKYP